MEGFCRVFGNDAYTLFSAKKAKSIISPSFSRACTSKKMRLFGVNIEVPRQGPLEIQAPPLVLKLDPSIGNTRNYDLILGQDWLEANYAVMDEETGMVRGQTSNAPSPPRRNDQNAATLEAVLQGLERVVRAATEVRPREGNDFFELYRSFTSLRPSNFDGAGGFLAAEDWLAEIQDKFRLVRAPEVNQVELAAQCLVGHARFWWQEAKRRYNGNPELVPWDWFKRQFEGRYLDTLSREKLRQNFLNLKQGVGTVSEFNSKFEDLMRYAPDVANDQFRLRQ
ncbi:hypothetical protein LUZ63_008735 [Rhynchospora breviuscula]|uniref:Retrotransposon gag domain-containing protein n=1 Tax=Rhynchospora breviuscula TaxID=2022672 RepID=A0A9Q0HMW4_9POAL|nr:hypothetical protein LUZ63_008735 [Rhynchospora breviuscula]